MSTHKDLVSLFFQIFLSQYSDTCYEQCFCDH